MKTIILTQHQAQLIMKNIPYGKSITGRNDHLQKILSSKPINGDNKKKR